MIVSLLAGCTADPPETPKYDLGKKDLLAPPPDWPPGCPAVPQLASPTLDLYPNPTSYALQAFRGRSPGAEVLTARSGIGTFKGSVGADGTFCIEVQLLMDSPNTVVFQGVDSKGCPGKETQVSIAHRSAPKQDGGVSAPVNLALKAPITSDTKPDKGELSYLNDGDAKSFAMLSYLDLNPMNTCTSHVWVRVDLGKVYTISKVKIIWAPSAGNEFAQCFAVLLSPASSPSDPSTSTGDWKVVKQVGNNTDPKDVIIPINPEPARWAALLLYDDFGTGLYETFQLAELEVWGQDPSATPPPPPDHCQ